MSPAEGQVAEAQVMRKMQRAFEANILNGFTGKVALKMLRDASACPACGVDESNKSFGDMVPNFSCGEQRSSLSIPAEMSDIP